jgi:hypothetical protein
MLARDLVLEGVTAQDVRALLTVLSGTRLTADEARRLREKGFLDPHVEIPLISLQGRTLLDQIDVMSTSTAEC